MTQQSNVRNLGKHVVTPKSSFCAKCIEKSRKQVKNGSFSADFWSKCGDSNSRPPVPETGALPTALHLEIIVLLLILLYHSAYLSACPRWRLLLKHSRTAREVKPLSLLLVSAHSLLAAARSRSGSDSPPDCHSIPSRRFATTETTLSCFRLLTTLLHLEIDVFLWLRKSTRIFY